uniref:Spermatosis and centriole associated 1 n=1 Tax=Canis lupus dingo TaxID=286419 RepID=A0A8C0L2I9_CANLU
MSLLTNYEGLRHQIERLVRENEELKKLVQLIRENHELRSAIKTHSGGLGISGFSSGLGEPTANPSQRVFLPQAPAAANEPVLEELGILTLAPLADVLCSPQPSPAAAPIVSPLTGPLNSLLPGPGSVSQSSPLTGLLSGHLAGPVAVSPGGMLASSLGLPSAGPMPLGSPLMGPVAGSVAVSLGSPLLTSTAAPLGISQNLLATPLSNLVLPEAPRGPQPFAGAGPAAQGKRRASINDTRGPRGSETSRKSILELERKLAHRKTSKFPESPRESKQLAWERLVGEIAFQLDRRILSSIFPERVRLYGFTVSNIPEKIIQASLNPSDHKLDEELCQTLTQRYVTIMNRLQSLGYNGRVHPALTEQLVNAYGILRERPELAASEGSSYSMDFLQRVLVETVHPSVLTDALLLLSCLSQLARDDGKPMFIW